MLNRFDKEHARLGLQKFGSGYWRILTRSFYKLRLRPVLGSERFPARERDRIRSEFRKHSCIPRNVKVKKKQPRCSAQLGRLYIHTCERFDR